MINQSKVWQASIIIEELVISSTTNKPYLPSLVVKATTKSFSRIRESCFSLFEFKIIYNIFMITKTKLIHSLPVDIKRFLATNHKAELTWKDITPLARNEWICWIISAKQLETRNRRIRIMLENLASGKRRPCCWAGCPHR